MTYAWETLEFRTAAPGWRIAAVIDTDGEVQTTDLPGWLVQEEVMLDPSENIRVDFDDRGNRTRPSRRVVPAWIEDGELHAADQDALRRAIVLAPSDPELTEEEIARMRQDLRSAQERRRARHAGDGA
jgi:hypothetical protein